MSTYLCNIRAFLLDIEHYFQQPLPQLSSKRKCTKENTKETHTYEGKIHK